MSLASHSEGKSVTELSESSVYHYQYTSIGKTIANLAKHSSDYNQMLHKIWKLLEEYYAPFSDSTCVYLLQIDVCNAEKGASHCFENRTQNYKANNQVIGNKPLSPGYAVSYINLYDEATGWSLPLHRTQVQINETESECAHSQLKSLLTHHSLPFHRHLCLTVSDSKYGNAAFLSSLYDYDNLVNIVRHRTGTTVYFQQEGKKSYGSAYTLIAKNRFFTGKNKSGVFEKEQYSIFNVAHQDFYTETALSSKGRKLLIEVYRWNNLKIRTRNGNNMKDKPLDLCCVRVLDPQTKELVFDKELWFTINGKRKAEVSTQKAYTSYRQRYAIEPYFRFNKQHLFFQGYQTPDSQHFNNWGLVSLLAVWLLFLAQKDIINSPKKWQQYLPKNKEIAEKPTTNLSLSQAYHSAINLFRSFDKTPFLPKLTSKPHGRRKGEKQKEREKFPIVKKVKKLKTNKKTASKCPPPPV